MRNMMKKYSAIALGMALAGSAGLAQAEGSCTPFCVDFSNTWGYGVTSDRVNIENIRVDVEVPNPFGGTPTLSSAYFNVAFDFNIESLHLIPAGIVDATHNDSTYCASLSVIVTNAVTGAALANAPVVVSGNYYWTNESGMVDLSGQFAGDAYIQASMEGFTEASRSTTLSCETPTTVALSLSPTTGEGALTTNEVRIVLSWGENPRDLDSHLTGPMDGAISDENRFHLYYANRSADAVASLDVDDTSSYGPETTTIVPPSGASHLRPGVYRYTVHHYSGSSDIAHSPASVDLIFGSGETRTFTPPADTTGLSGGSRDTWTVFELIVADDGTVSVSPVNTYASEVSPSAVRTTTGYGEVESGVDFSRLPPK